MTRSLIGGGEDMGHFVFVQMDYDLHLLLKEYLDIVEYSQTCVSGHLY